ncbi:MAG: Maf family protein [Alphaproteobacteria bacterium]|nr:Maf family protein [Alphaproteobacteria bacterium]
MTERPSLVLASASSIRAELLRRAGLDIAIEAAVIDEAAIKAGFRAEGRGAAECALALAEAKAARVARRHAGALVIGADQILVCGDEWYDKPADERAARAQLLALRGRRHELVTAACVFCDGARLWHCVERPMLTMRDFGAGFLDSYLERSGETILASVGAYRLEAIGIQLFARIEGDYFAILGLPLLPLLGFLRDHGILAR